MIGIWIVQFFNLVLLRWMTAGLELFLVFICICTAKFLNTSIRAPLSIRVAHKLLGIMPGFCIVEYSSVVLVWGCLLWEDSWVGFVARRHGQFLTRSCCHGGPLEQWWSHRAHIALGTWKVCCLAAEVGENCHLILLMWQQSAHIV